MSKLQKTAINAPTVLLDTSTQPLLGVGEPLVSGRYTEKQISLQKRARSKAISDAFVLQLIDIKSNLKKNYWNAWHCNRTILQEGEKLHTRYCNTRWCMVCNRIRSAKLRTGYEPAIAAMNDPWFVTSTHRTVSGHWLKRTLDQDLKVFNLCKRVMAKEGTKLVGIRKVEIEYNVEDGKFHAHIHSIIEGEAAARRFNELWVSKHPLHTDMKAQDVRPATDTKELFKYFTKMISKVEVEGQIRFDPKAMDTVFRAMVGRRVIQPFGGFTKVVSEDVEVEGSTDVDWRYISSPEEREIWCYEEAGKFSDWYNANGEPLSEVDGLIMNKETLNFIAQINGESKERRRQTTDKQPSIQ